MDINLVGNNMPMVGGGGAETLAVTQALALLFAAAAALLLAVLAQVGHRSLYRHWALAWTAYGIYFAAMFCQSLVPTGAYLQVVGLIAVGLAALALVSGIQELEEQPLGHRVVWLASTVIIASGIGAYVLDGLWVYGPLMFGGLAVAAAHTAKLHDRRRQENRGMRIAAVGFGLWSIVSLAAAGFVEWTALQAATHFLTAVAATVLAVGVVVEREVFASEEKYRSVLEAARDAVFIVDMWSLKILDANQGAQRLSKRDLVSLLGASFLELCPDLKPQASNLMDHRKMFAAVFKPYHEFHLIRADGPPLLCEGETSLVRWNDRAVVQVRIRKVAEERKLGQLVRRAEKMSSLGQLIAGVAHELNNPLAVVVGYAQLLSKQPLPNDKVRHNLQHILHESERAAKIVTDLLSFVRPCEPQLTVTDLNELVGNVLDIRDAEFQSQEIQVQRHLAEHLPPTKVDPMQIEQVLNNLVTNALHVLSAQGGPRELHVTTAEADFFLRITIRDTGPGIKEEILGKIFEPFFTTKAPGKGTGLGLAISHSILEEHHGRLTVESTYGQGATFCLELPLVAAEIKSEEPDDLLEAMSAVPEVAQTRLLVVDDEPGIREVLETVLSELGYQVDCAANGQQALGRISTCRYDLIISDMCMPEVDGEKLYETVKDSDPHLARRILFLTGDTVSNKSRAFLERTGNRWMSKPFNIHGLEQAISGALRQQLVSFRTETGQRVD